MTDHKGDIVVFFFGRQPEKDSSTDSRGFILNFCQLGKDNHIEVLKQFRNNTRPYVIETIGTIAALTIEPLLSEEEKKDFHKREAGSAVPSATSVVKLSMKRKPEPQEEEKPQQKKKGKSKPLKKYDIEELVSLLSSKDTRSFSCQVDGVLMKIGGEDADISVRELVLLYLAKEIIGEDRIKFKGFASQEPRDEERTDK